MRGSTILLLIASSVFAEAQATFESPDFNITDALVDLGVNITALPQLDGLAERSSSAACSIACGSLQVLFGPRVITQASSAYDGFTNSYWSVQQASVDPYCIFKPSASAQVSVTVLISRLTQCPFAVRSGGHAAFAGASNIQGGITISLQDLNQITLSADQKTAAVGPGNVWYDVYVNLANYGLAVIGGRVSGIGVGGLTTGGGISFFSNIYGWACDNVASYEVVTASGIIVNATPTSFSDLYWALRGGGNNFGIVTKFTLNTIKQRLMWGGSRIHLEDQFAAVINAFCNLGVNSAKDPNAAQIVSFAYAQSADLNVVAADLQYALPVSNAPIFSEFFAIPPLQDNTKVRSLADLTQQFNASNPDGLRETYWAATYKLDKAHVTYVKDIFYQELAAIKDAAGLVPAATLQVITVPQLQQMVKNGGNPLGISAADGPLLLLNMNMMWTNTADDARILKANSNIIKRTVAQAQTVGLYNDYIYMNYASQFQAVIPSYGSANQARLKSIAARYDPARVYQELQPGYFKLDGAPNPNMP